MNKSIIQQIKLLQNKIMLEVINNQNCHNTNNNNNMLIHFVKIKSMQSHKKIKAD